ncbi:glycogen debranching protein GlgX [Kocuria marina]|uniref:glycogen debranching protein GlgX n=1 Tax=Kocuria marina TaxID=223184 RepID=UPI002989A1C1|nr:glycogen debranching protein GlgX [Kocuria marina]MCT1722630.1 glycogen debranching protein GlgX [Kocuria marina]MCT1734345.1 glycogen debranching protein GlgX [Kocuria marina]
MQARSYPLGVHPSPSGDGTANVAVYAPGLTEVDLMFRRPGESWQRLRLAGENHGIHYATVSRPRHVPEVELTPGELARDVCPAMPEGTEYGFVSARPEGSPVPDPAYEPVLLDPYGRGLTRVAPPSGVVNPGADAYGGEYVSVVVAQDHEWRDHDRPRPAWRETVIYEAHVKGLTMLHPGIPHELRGTYAGLAHPVMLEYLRSLGITAVELLPVHAHLDEAHLTANGLTNYWGYNTLAFFAPHAGYATKAAQEAGPTAVLNEFKAAVDALHGAGLQVFLDVVYNHTAEGGPTQRPYCWRGLGDREYYRHDEHGNYVDVTGCGNSMDFGNPQVVRMALDSLRYWVTQCHVDGFRFDLAPELGRDEHHHFTRNHPFFVAIAADPVLQGVRMISEPWDVGAGGWQTGRFPTGWADWNDHYRDTVRDFWLSGQRTMRRGGGGGTAGRLAGAISGSADLFAPHGRTTLASVNFITAHDGFTLYDLTAYDAKHNEANRENNADGTNDNHSWNHDHEGFSPDVRVRAARAATARNMMATLLFSQGIPMITAGDELLRSQDGNNNAYCQDNRLSWVDWRLTPLDRSILRTTQRLIRIRRAFLASQPRDFPTRPRDVVLKWYASSGEPMSDDLWQTDGVRALQVVIGARGGDLAGLFVLNGTASPVAAVLPRIENLAGSDVDGASYRLVLATDPQLDELTGNRWRAGEELTVPAQSIAMFAIA